jgi:selenocysteine lyase/cysteine desulfurase
MTHSQPTAGTKMTVPQLRDEIVGIDTRVPLLDGSMRRYVFLDNAASTPTFRRVLKCVEEFLPWYSGVHRGTGFKSIIATEVFDRAHEIAGEFVGADLSTNTVVFVKNTTEAINKISNRMGFKPDDLVITTAMEHHSNDLPWRKNARVIHIGIVEDGSLDIESLREALRHHAGKVRLVAINGASNITGICNPIHDIAEWAHEAGAMIFVDAAQLVPHRRVDMLPDNDPRHIDFIAYSAHKMYAPFGTGVLIGPKKIFREGEPDMVGGGTVEVVSLDEVYWTAPPLKEEAGSPNIVGGIALAEAITILQEVGLDAIADHEHRLLEYAYGRMKRIPDVILYGPTENLCDKVGVIAFNVRETHHALVASVLSTEGGIGVRNGCFCAHPYVKKLLKLPPEEEKVLEKEMLSGVKANIPGMVRASFGCYTNEADIDAFVEMLEKIVRREYRGSYVMDPATGVFLPDGFTIDVRKYFPFYHAGEPSMERRFSESA